MNKILLITLAAITLIGATILYTQNVDAHDGFGAKPRMGRFLEKKAEVLNMSVDELKAQLENNTFAQILESQGMTKEDLRASMIEQKISFWQEEGLSEEEIAERLVRMNERHKNGEFPKFHRFR